MLGILDALAYSHFGRAVIQTSGIINIDLGKAIGVNGLKYPWNILRGRLSRRVSNLLVM
jgi:hypothetical protein